VSMGSNAAWMCARVIDNTYDVLSIHALAVVEAIDCLGLAGQMSPQIATLHKQIRTVATPITQDSPKYPELAAIKALLQGVWI
jgi:histidine ammonia-lyase